jgi:cell fate (sporulation/competence/biofilm development) regulator YlbF (YheA/YmcA/DUF963 family)
MSDIRGTANKTEIISHQQRHEEISENDAPIEFDPVKTQSDLKSRMRQLNRLVTEGHNILDIKELRAALDQTIKDLDEIINDPELAHIEGIE